MKRSMAQVYVQRNNKAIELYQKAINAKITDAYSGDNDTYYLAELDIYGQILAVAESEYDGVCSNNKIEAQSLN